MNWRGRQSYLHGLLCIWKLVQWEVTTLFSHEVPVEGLTLQETSERRGIGEGMSCSELES